MTSDSRKEHSTLYIEPAQAAGALRDFLAGLNQKRLMLFTGVSGIGKSTLLRHLSEKEHSIVYIDTSVRNTPLGILQEIYKTLNPDEELLTKIVHELKGLYSFYLSNVANVKVTKSNITNTNITSSVPIVLSPSSADHGLFYQSASRIIRQALSNHDYCVILDQFEEANDNHDVRVLVRSLLVDTTTLRIVLSGKRPIHNDFIQPEDVTEFAPHGFTQSETILYLQKRGLSDLALSGEGFKVSAGHPLFLRIFADAIEKGLDIDDSILTAARDDRFRLLVNRIADSLAPPLRKAFYYLPLCRYFSHELIRYVFKMDSFNADEIIRRLCDELYCEAVEDTELLRFHELFTNLRRRELPRDEQIDFDNRVISFYQGLYDTNRGFSSLHELVEPFYHLQHVSSELAFEFFERHYKPILDKKQKGVAGILVGQVLLEKVDDRRVRNWYLLRIGGFYREFNLFDEAKKHFLEILETPDLDKKLTAYALNNLGICYLFTDESEKCRDLFLQSNVICDELGLTTIKAHNLSNLGIFANNIGDLQAAKGAYEESYRLYRADAVEGLYIGKLLQNYAQHLERQNKYELAEKSILSAEQEYLKDNDLVGGITCRLHATECLLDQDKYHDADEMMQRYCTTFDQILRGCGLQGHRGHLAYIQAIIALYNSRPNDYVAYAEKSLEYTFLSGQREHSAMASKMLNVCIVADAKELLLDLIKRIEVSDGLRLVADQLAHFLRQHCEQSWCIRDSSSVVHVPECQRYKNGHFLKKSQMVSRAVLLTQNDLLTCDCMHNGNQLKN